MKNLFVAVLISTMATCVSAGVIDWEKHTYDQAEKFKDIPDMVNMTDLRFYFKVVHWALTGV
jgi:hypothetical protein